MKWCSGTNTTPNLLSPIYCFSVNSKRQFECFSINVCQQFYFLFQNLAKLLEEWVQRKHSVYFCSCKPTFCWYCVLHFLLVQCFAFVQIAKHWFGVSLLFIWFQVLFLLLCHFLLCCRSICNLLCTMKTCIAKTHLNSLESYIREF